MCQSRLRSLLTLSVYITLGSLSIAIDRNDSHLVRLNQGGEAMKFADRLAYLRAERMLTQKQLAEAAGVGIATIARSEAGGSVPHGATLQKLAAALGVEIKDMI